MIVEKKIHTWIIYETGFLQKKHLSSILMKVHAQVYQIPPWPHSIKTASEVLSHHTFHNWFMLLTESEFLFILSTTDDSIYLFISKTYYKT